MKKHIVHNFSFYIHKKIYKKPHKKKKLYIKLIFSYQEKRESYFFFYLGRERMKIESDRMNLCLTFYFFFKT